MFDKLIDVSTIVKFTGLSRWTVVKLLKVKKIGFRVGNKYFTTKEKIKEVFPDVEKLIKDE